MRKIDKIKRKENCLLTLRGPAEGLGDGMHVRDHSLNSVSVSFDLSEKLWHLVPVEGVIHTAVDVLHRCCCVVMIFLKFLKKVGEFEASGRSSTATGKRRFASF